MGKWEKWFITTDITQPTKKAIKRAGLEGKPIKRVSAGKIGKQQFWQWKVWR